MKKTTILALALAFVLILSMTLVACGETGPQGEAGRDGHTPVITIGTNGNWFVDGVDTGVQAQGIQGEQGAVGPQGPQGAIGPQGEKGEDGHTPEITIGSNGNWYIDGVDSGVQAQGIQGEQGAVGPQGPQGATGAEGHTPVITIGANGNWFVDGVDTGVQAQGIQGEQGAVGPQGPQGATGAEGHTPVITIGVNGNWFVDGVDTGVQAQGIQGEQGVVGPQGPQGEQGKDGADLLTGNGTPTNTLGKDGDVYINIDNFDFYINNNGQWKFNGNLVASFLGHDGTEGLEFYPLNDNECAVAAGTAKYLEEIIIPATYKHYTVTTILDNAFEGSKNMTKITLPDTLTKIGSNAFDGCTSLIGIDIPDSVTTIGSSAFWGCTSLTSIDIPASVTTIGANAFASCSKLKSVYFKDTANWYAVGFVGYDLKVYSPTDVAMNLKDSIYTSHTWRKSATE